MSPNPAGVNQLSPHGYGDRKRNLALKRAAPISGAPMVAGALNAAQQTQRQAVRGTQAQAQPAGQPAMPGPPTPMPTAQAQITQIGRVVAAMPGASDLIKQLVG